jgi:hypothetical protein
MRRKGLRQRAARLDLLVHVVEHRLEAGVRDPLAQNVERLDERHARFEQRGQLLIEDEELLPGDAAARAEGKRQARQAGPPLERKDVQPLFFQLLPQARLAVGDVDPLDDVAARRPEPTAKFHRNSVAYQSSQ